MFLKIKIFNTSHLIRYVCTFCCVAFCSTMFTVSYYSNFPMFATLIWSNVGRTSLCDSKNTTEEAGRWVTRVKSLNSIPGVSSAPGLRRDAGFGHRSS